MTRPATISPVVRRHLLVGWWTIFGYSLLGVTLEALHAFKVGDYVDGGNDVRRLMWTLAHAHGTLLGLMNIGFAVTVATWPTLKADLQQRCSVMMRASTALLPLGFFAGGLRFYGGDPGLGAALIPVGAILLLYAVWLVATGVARSE